MEVPFYENLGKLRFASYWEEVDDPKIGSATGGHFVPPPILLKSSLPKLLQDLEGKEKKYESKTFLIDMFVVLCRDILKLLKMTEQHQQQQEITRRALTIAVGEPREQILQTWAKFFYHQEHVKRMLRDVRPPYKILPTDKITPLERPKNEREEFACWALSWSLRKGADGLPSEHYLLEIDFRYEKMLEAMRELIRFYMPPEIDKTPMDENDLNRTKIMMAATRFKFVPAE